MKRNLVITVIAFALTFTPRGLAQGAETIVGLAAALKAIQSVIEQTITQVDNVTANKLEDINTRITVLLREIDPLIEHGKIAANEVTSKVAKDAHMLLRDLGATIGKNKQSIFNQLNESAGVAALIVDALPVASVDPYVSAVVPSRIKVDFDTQSTPLKIYGFLPGEVGKDIRVLINGVPAETKRTGQNGLSVTLPSTISLKESSLIAIAVSINRSKMIFFSSQTAITEHVYVEKNEPYKYTIKVFHENPQSVATVAAQKPFVVTASTQGGASNPSVNRTIGVEELLAGTVEESLDKYDIKDAYIRKPGYTFEYYGECAHKSPHAELKSWNMHSISVRLEAPHVSTHVWHGRDRHNIKVAGKTVGHYYTPTVGTHNGGGTKAVVYLKPTFVVHVKGAPSTIQKGEPKVGTMGWQSELIHLDLPTDKAWSVHVDCDFEDGAEKWSSGHLVLGPSDTSQVGRGIVADIADGILSLSPVAPTEIVSTEL